MKDEFERDIICESENKICFTEREANEALKGAKSHNNRSKKIPVRKYFCSKCGHYHLTSQSASHNKRDRLQEKYRYKKERLRKRENKYDWREEYSLFLSA